MADILTAFYPNRHNRDGSYDFICLVCFATVVSARTTQELIGPSTKHICNPSTMLQRAFDSALSQRH
jgi:hypothetical protein